MQLYYYEYEHDNKYCYPNSNTLRNKLNIRDDKILREAERNITALRILELKRNAPKGKLDFKYLCKLHRYIFGDIYSWAGKIRSVDISKGNIFCKSEFIIENADVVFRQLEVDNYLRNIEEIEIPIKLAYYLSEINAVHPFREGNGRAQRAYIEILAGRVGYEVDFSDAGQDEMIRASAEAFHKEYKLINELFSKITKPIDWNE